MLEMVIFPLPATVLHPSFNVPQELIDAALTWRTRSHISEALKAGTGAWGINLEQQVIAFTTDNGSNIVKSVEEDLGKLCIPCAGHTLNLSVQAALKVNTVGFPQF